MPDSGFVSFGSAIVMRASTEVNGEIITAQYWLPREQWEHALEAGAEDALWSYVHSTLSEAVMSSLTVSTRLERV